MAKENEIKQQRDELKLRLKRVQLSYEEMKSLKEAIWRKHKELIAEHKKLIDKYYTN